MSKRQPKRKAPEKTGFRLTHKCYLSQETKAPRISHLAPWYKRCWFHFREYCTIYKNYESSSHFRSNASLLKEKNRHLKHRDYRYIIHPYSKLLRRKRVLMFFIWFIVFLVDPYLGSFMAPTYMDPNRSDFVVLDYLIGAMNVLLAVDIMIQFSTGYIIEKTGQIILHPHQVANNYVTSYFLVDLIPTVLSLVLVCVKSLMPITVHIVIFQLKYIRMFRLNTMVKNFRVLLKMCHFNDSFITFAVIAIIVTLLLHWWTCLVALVPIIREIYNVANNNSWKASYDEERYFLTLIGDVDTVEFNKIDDYLQHMQIVMCHFYGAGLGRYRTTDSVEEIIFSLILMSGLTFYVLSLANVLEILSTVHISEAKFEEFDYETQQYMTRSRFSKRLKRRIASYIDYKLTRKFFSEEKILNTLSEHLRMEVLLYSCRNLVDNVFIFKGLSKAAVGSILALLKQEIFLPKDVVMSTEKDSGKLFFILYGTCMVKVVTGQEISHVEDGNQFGEVTMLQDDSSLKLVYKVVALETSEIYMLDEQDLKFCCSHYPEVLAKLKGTIAKEKRKYFRNITALAAGSKIDTSDILGQLRKGRIVTRGRKREIGYIGQ